MKKHYKTIHHMKSSKEKYKSNVQYTLEEYNDIFSSRSKECPVCHKHYLDSFKMRRHLRSIHSSYFSEELQLMIESRIKSKDTGDYTLEQWRDIVATKSNECPVCHKTYSTPSRMRRHLREIHRAQKKYICDVCGKQFSTPRRVREHRKKTHEESGNGEDIFECDICKKIMRSKHSISDHMSLHTGYKMHHCKYCNESFGFSSELTRHKKRHKLLRGELDSTDIHECNICNKTFIEKHLYVRHMDWIHGDDSDKYNLCKICGQKFKHIRRHMLTHTKEDNVCCHICGKNVRRKYLQKHIMTHTGEKPFACNVCGSSFNAKSNLTRHMHKHDGERPFECKFCTKKFLTQTSYKLHLRKHEMGSMTSVTKIHVCQICKVRFESERELNSHYPDHFTVT